MIDAPLTRYKLAIAASALEAEAARGNTERLLAVLPSTARVLEQVALYRQLGHFQGARDCFPLAPDLRVKAYLQQRRESPSLS
jgi:hypothetical protein